MIIFEIGYGSSFEIKDEFNKSEWFKANVKATLQEEDDVIKSLETLKNNIDTFFVGSCAIKKSSYIEINSKRTELLEDTLPVDTMILEIEACTELTKDATKGLLSFENTPKNAAQKAAYDFKRLQLLKK